MRPKTYLETTIVSYLAAAPSRDVVIAGHQQVTREWWEQRNRFELFVSQAVVDEAARGDATVAARRTALLNGIPVLELGTEVYEVANRLLLLRAVPAKAMIDAIHIAVTAVNRVDYLLTWNCRHIANAAVRGKIEQACRAVGPAGTSDLYARGVDGGLAQCHKIRSSMKSARTGRPLLRSTATISRPSLQPSNGKRVRMDVGSYPSLRNESPQSRQSERPASRTVP